MIRLPVDDALSMGLSVFLGFPFIVTLFILRPLLSAFGLWEVARTDEAASTGTTELTTGTNLNGKVCVVTGANCGIGLRTAAQLARLGATVVLACRDIAKAEAAAANISAELAHISAELESSGASSSSSSVSRPECGRAVPMVLDLSKLASVDAFAAAFTARFGKKLHAIVCNAGVPAGLRQRTAEGFSLDFGVSFIGHFELVRALLPALQATEGSRVVTVSSVMHWFGQRAATADWVMAAFDTYPLYRRALVSSYSDAKSALLLLAVALRARGIGAVSVNPGAVSSEIWRYLPPLVRRAMGVLQAACFLTPEQGAAPSVHAAAAQPVPTSLYLCPYVTSARLQPLLELAGPFAGARPAHCKAEREAAGDPEVMRRDAERLWRWAEEAVLAARRC